MILMKVLWAFLSVGILGALFGIGLYIAGRLSLFVARLCERKGIDVMDSQPLFQIGKLMMTSGVAAEEFTMDELLDLIRRHVHGDFGEINEEDRQENLLSIREGFRIMSVYSLNDTKVWVISEADRSVTTILRPDEY